MNWTTTIDEVKDLCYQCEFRAVVEAVDNYLKMDPDPESFFSSCSYISPKHYLKCTK